MLIPVSRRGMRAGRNTNLAANGLTGSMVQAREAVSRLGVIGNGMATSPVSRRGMQAGRSTNLAANGLTGSMVQAREAVSRLEVIGNGMAASPVSRRAEKGLTQGN